jgi:hypothetical protein
MHGGTGVIGGAGCMGELDVLRNRRDWRNWIHGGTGGIGGTGCMGELEHSSDSRIATEVMAKAYPWRY